MKKVVVIFDGNHLLYRAYYKFANLKTIEGVKTSIIFGVPRIVESLIRVLSPTETIMVYDGEKSEFRKSLLPNYKNREKRLGWDADDFFRQRDVTIMNLQYLGIKVARREDLEADDVIAMITRRYVNKGYEVIIASGDKDFNQLIDDQVSIYNTSKAKMYTKANLQSLVGYQPEQTVDFLTMLGDDSDKIPGYHGIGEKKALNLLDTYGSIKEFLKSGDKFGKVDNNKLKALAKLNKKLIDIRYYYRKFLMRAEIPFLNPNPKWDEKAFKISCGVYETNSFLKKQFIKTYKNLYHGK